VAQPGVPVAGSGARAGGVPAAGSAAQPGGIDAAGSAAQAGGIDAAGSGARPGGVTAGEVVGLLVARGVTVAVAESLTGGLLTAALTGPAGASAAVRGGLVVYATDLKAQLAGVPAPLLDALGPVAPEVAAALAAGARDRLGATYGLGVTGVAGPDPQGGQPVGTVFLGLAGPTGGEVRRLALTGDRAAIRAGTVDAALSLLAAALREPAPESTD
jgi:nicotinamide-nucleotide amidase